MHTNPMYQPDITIHQVRSRLRRLERRLAWLRSRIDTIATPDNYDQKEADALAWAIARWTTTRAFASAATAASRWR